MTVFGYSEEGKQRLLKKQLRPWVILLTTLVVGSMAVPISISGTRMLWLYAPITILLVVGAVLLGRRKARKMLDVTEVELTEDALIFRSPMVESTIPRDEVVELRYLPNGTVSVIGQKQHQWTNLSPELAHQNQLVAAVEQWVPESAIRTGPDAARTNPALREQRRSVVISFLIVFMFIVAAVARAPYIVIPAALSGAAILLGLQWQIWRNKEVSNMAGAPPSGACCSPPPCSTGRSTQ